MVTDGIRISVETFYLTAQSDPARGHYTWAYRITIANESDRTVQLLRRHWIITDANERVTEVEGEGVVGEQPVIPPGRSHTYTSGSSLETPFGTMEGTYELVREGGGRFRARIPMFLLGRPGALQ
jgi:ApaG protein